MSTLAGSFKDEMLEECLDDLDGMIQTLERFPESVLAYALRIQLGSLLRVLMERDLCAPVEAAEFLSDLAEDVLRS